MKQLKVLIAPDKFKGTLSAAQVAEAIEKGLKAVPDIHITKSPVADGGEGTLDTIFAVTGGSKVIKTVKGPYGKPVKATYVKLPKREGQPPTAIIEMSKASGLNLTGRIKRPMIASTYGTGELIKSALNSGCRRIIISMGGSATNDAGIGALQALGVRFLGPFSKKLKARGGKALPAIMGFDDSWLDKRTLKTEFILATDVTNPFFGENGAISTYGSQKGANPAEKRLLERGFRHFAKIVKREKSVDLQTIKGSGAAGGLAGGLIAFLPKATIEPGFNFVSRLTNLEEKIKKSDLIITGEGQIDWQTAHGKGPYGVLQLAKRNKKKTLAICGSLGAGWEELLADQFWVIYSILGQRAYLRKSDTKPVIDKPFHHKLPLNVKKEGISKRYSKKNAFKLLQFFSPEILKDFREHEWEIKIREAPASSDLRLRFIKSKKTLKNTVRQTLNPVVSRIIKIKSKVIRQRKPKKSKKKGKEGVSFFKEIRSKPVEDRLVDFINAKLDSKENTKKTAPAKKSKRKSSGTVDPGQKKLFD